MKKTVTSIQSKLTEPFVYVDCGSRGEQTKALLELFEEAIYVGFDPGLDDSEKVEEDGTHKLYFPVALGSKSETKTFYHTQNPNCSSVFSPDKEFVDRFVDIGPFFNTLQTSEVDVVALDDFLPPQGIDQVDFIELDTQGSELEILQGAKKLLTTEILGLRVEVEFTAMYHDQPLFADVDSFLRQYDFMLFDLERYHLRRKTAPPKTFSREQVVWGQALYFKDWKHTSVEFTKQKLEKFIMVALFYGFYSYALEILEYLLDESTGLLTLEEKEQITNVCYQHVSLSGLTFKERIFAMFRKFSGCIELSLNTLLGQRQILPKQDYFWKD